MLSKDLCGMIAVELLGPVIPGLDNAPWSVAEDGVLRRFDESRQVLAHALGIFKGGNRRFKVRRALLDRFLQDVSLLLNAFGLLSQLTRQRSHVDRANQPSYEKLSIEGLRKKGVGAFLQG